MSGWDWALRSSSRAAPGPTGGLENARPASGVEAQLIGDGDSLFDRPSALRRRGQTFPLQIESGETAREVWVALAPDQATVRE